MLGHGRRGDPAGIAGIEVDPRVGRLARELGNRIVEQAVAFVNLGR
jgi:hypothetical protein